MQGIEIGEGSSEKIAELVSRVRHTSADVAVLADRRPMAAATGELKREIEARLEPARLPVRRVLIGEDDPLPQADATTLRLGMWEERDVEELLAQAARLGAGL